MGKGSYGKVRVATDTLTGRIVAVKQQAITSKTAFREHRFFMWLRASTNASFSQGACRVLSLLDDFTDCGGSIWSSFCSQALVPRAPVRAKFLYMVFPYMDSSVEHQFRSRRGHLDRDVVVRWSREIVAGLTFLHSASIVHGDLTMANILLDAACSVRIADFGLAFSSNDSSDDRRGYCTAYIRSPEVFLAADNPSFPVDIWALGVVVLTLLSGSRLFIPRDAEGDEGAQVLEAHVEVLGTPRDWPALQSLRLFAKYREVLERPPRHSSPEAFLADSAVVTCPLLPGDPGVAFALSGLRFNPDLRPSAQQLQSHAWLKEPSVDALRAALLRMPKVALEDVVLRLATGEMAATVSMVQAHCHMQALAPPAPALEVRPPSGSPSTGGAESATASNGLCGENPVLPKDGIATCECSGNCGWPACRRRRRDRLQRCAGVVVRGGFCADCICELVSCEKPRNEIKGQRRWCSKHGGEVSSNSRYYSNLYGLNWKFDPAWSPGLRVVVHLGYALRRMVPEDIRAWREHCAHRGYGASPGEPLDTGAFMDLVSVGMVKWPESVRRITGQPPWPTAPAEAAAYLRDVVRHANGRRMTQYHDQCTSGRGYSHTGLVWFAKRVGLLDESRRGRKAQKTQCQEVALGKAGVMYKVAESPEVAEEWFTKVARVTPDVKWPGSASELRAFLGTVGDAFAEAVGVSRESYTVCGWVRKVALLFPDEWLDKFADDLSVAEWSAFAPFSPGADTEALQSIGTSKHLRHVVGMHFFWFALWWCSAGGLSPEATTTLLQESPGTVLNRASRRSVSDTELVSPGMPFLVSGEA